MNTRYSIHPKEFLLGITEKYYSDMAAKGWELEEHGKYFSRFRKTPPKQMRYRVKIAAKCTAYCERLPEEQIAIYEDCGWEYVTGSGFIHIFRAPEGSDAPEFYTEPQQQAATLKGLRRRYIISLTIAILLIIVLLLPVIFFDELIDFGNTAQFYKKLIDESAAVIAIGILFLFSVLSDLWGAAYINGVYRKMKKGVPLNHSPKSGKLFSVVRISQAVFFIGILIFIIHGYLNFSIYNMPETPQYPYIQLSEFSVEGQRTANIFNGEESSVKENRSLLSEHWQTREFLDSPDGSFLWLYQDVYILINEAMADSFVKALMADSIFAKSTEAYVLTEIDGLDKAYVTTGNE